MAAQPASLVVAETREMLLTQFSGQLMAAGHHAELVQALTSPLARQDGLTASLHFVLGLAQMELKQFVEAAAQMRQCLALRDRPSLAPVNPEVRRAGPRHCLARCLLQTADPDGAEREFKLALEECPDATAVSSNTAAF